MEIITIIIILKRLAIFPIARKNPLCTRTYKYKGRFYPQKVKHET